MRKITVMVPEELLERAMRVSGQGITPTIVEGLEKVGVAEYYEKVLAMRGTVKLKPLPWLRED